MYIGQISANPWLNSTWLNHIGRKQGDTDLSAARSQGQAWTQPNSANRDRLELSGFCLPNRLRRRSFALPRRKSSTPKKTH